jgi:CubicO group peptidase (beta-lactamase class C family)
VVRIVHAPPVDGIIDARLGIDRSNWDHPPHLALSQLRMDRMMPVVYLEPAQTIALPRAPQTLDIDALTFDDPWTTRTLDGAAFLNRRLFNDALLVMHRGRVIHETYRNGMTADDHHVQHSTTKSLTTMLLAQAIDAGRMDLSAPFDRYLPELTAVDGWHGVTLQHVLDMAAGVKYVESYEDRNSDYHSYARAVGYYPATANESIGARRWLIQHMTQRDAAPGTRFNYASPLTNALMMAAEHALEAPILELLEEHLFRRIGAESVGWFNTDGVGFPIAEGQLSLTLRDFARWASVMINDGCNLAGERIVARSFIADTCAPNPASHAAFNAVEPSARFPRGHYRNQFWITEPELDQFTMLGIHGQFAWFDLRAELMIIGYGSFPVATSPLLTLAQQELWRRIGDALRGS